MVKMRGVMYILYYCTHMGMGLFIIAAGMAYLIAIYCVEKPVCECAFVYIYMMYMV